jgi:multiple sugar transport system substrate-binding protein
MILSALVNHTEGFEKGGKHLQGVAMKRTSSSEDLQFDRRAALKGLAAAAGLVTIPGALAACSSSTSTPSGGGTSASAGTSGGTISFGSNYSDPAPKQAFAALVSNAKKATGVNIAVNTVDHNTFQDDITSYLQGTPNDLATWFAGYRMQYFAAQGLLEPVDDVWDKIGANFSDAVKALCKGADGKYYFVPIYNYPWVVFYNKSTFTQKGYTVPATWDDLITLAKKMKSDGLVPFAFADKDQWPALGLFDILNLRVNGFDYHIKLMHNQASYTDSQVTDVFNQWSELLPYMQSGAAGRIWEDAAKTLEAKQAGMMFQGTNQVAAQYVTDGKKLDDLAFFPFPTINPTFGQDYIDAPMDGFILPAKAKNKDAAKQVLEYIGTGAAEASYLKYDQWDVAVATGAQVPTYNSIQTASVQAMANLKGVAQFGDRDTAPPMATALETAILKFIANPAASGIKPMQSSLASQAKSIF